MKISRSYLLCKIITFVFCIFPKEIVIAQGTSQQSLLKKILTSPTPILNESVQDPLLKDLIFWLNAQKGAPQFPSFEALADFINRHPTWPCCGAFQKKVEANLVKNTPAPHTLVSFFEKNPPLTPKGKIFYIKALIATQQKHAAKEKAKTYWRETLMVPDEEAHFFTHLGAFIDSRDHALRFEKLVFQEDILGAERLLSKIPLSLKRHGTTALGFLKKKNSNSPKCFKDLPLSFQKNEMLLWSYLKWLKSQKAYREICDIFFHLPSPLKNPQVFHKLRILAARELLEAQKPQGARKVLISHELKAGADYAEAEWLLGWISLCFLKDPLQAEGHFKNFESVVKTPISLSRAYYWLGRTYTDLKKPQKAEKAYEKAAKYKTTFYGQWACYALQKCPFPIFQEKPRVSAQERKKFNNNQLVRAIRLLAPLERPAHLSIVRLLSALAASSQTRAEKQLIAELSTQVHPYIAVDLSRTLSLKDSSMPFLRKAYPLPSTPSHLSKNERALSLAICYRESRFNPEIKGGAGELGLMQLMPQTAVEVAQALNLPHHPQKLLNPHYNMHLGSALLRDLLDVYDQNYFLAIAAYNAGRGAVGKWIQNIGHPKTKVMGVSFTDPFHALIHWTEAIPYEGTRDYVARGIEAFVIYAGLLGKSPEEVWQILSASF